MEISGKDQCQQPEINSMDKLTAVIRGLRPLIIDFHGYLGLLRISLNSSYIIIRFRLKYIHTSKLIFCSIFSSHQQPSGIIMAGYLTTALAFKHSQQIFTKVEVGALGRPFHNF